MKKQLLILFFALAASSGLWSQTNRAIQVSGVVVATDSLLPVPYATIYRSADHRGTYTDYNGYFTMPVLAGDTLHFVSIGLLNSSFVVPTDTTQSHISIVQWMQVGEVILPIVDVTPYPSPGRLRQELLALDLPGDRYNKFQRGAVSARNYDGLNDLSDEAFSEASETLISRYTSGFRSGGNLLDPSAWGKFMKAIKGKGPDE